MSLTFAYDKIIWPSLVPDEAEYECFLCMVIHNLKKKYDKHTWDDIIKFGLLFGLEYGSDFE